MNRSGRLCVGESGGVCGANIGAVLESVDGTEAAYRLKGDEIDVRASGSSPFE